MSNNSMATSTILLFLLAVGGLAAAHGDPIRLPSEGDAPPPPAKHWDCCDDIALSPLKIFPQLYRCIDDVKQFSAACKECVAAPAAGDSPCGGGAALVCRDWYSTEDPGKPCTPEREWPERTTKKRPWKCCDNIRRLPPRIHPPFWRCDDELKPGQCFAACKACREAPGPFPGPLICDDVYWGADPGPFCTPRPWGDCCDNTTCTKSIPPICSCGDKVAACDGACKDCQPVASSSEPPRFVCKDQFTGQPGPKCTPCTQN